MSPAGMERHLRLPPLSAEVLKSSKFFPDQIAAEDVAGSNSSSHSSRSIKSIVVLEDLESGGSNSSETSLPRERGSEEPEVFHDAPLEPVTQQAQQAQPPSPARLRPFEPLPPQVDPPSPAKLPPPRPPTGRRADGSPKAVPGMADPPGLELNSFAASISVAAVSLEDGEREMEKNRKAASSMARDNALWEEVEADTKELIVEDFIKKDPLFMPKPPTNCYEACARIGVESATLAALAPPLLLSPRYKAHNSPSPKASQDILNARLRVHGALVNKSVELPDGSIGQRKPRRFNYGPVLEEQGSDLEEMSKSFAGYQEMMAEFEKQRPTFFDFQRNFVANGGHFFPLDQPTRLKLKLARVIGIAPQNPECVPE
uniref:Uncharacterized protein n=1 Tax=Eutreptiella gymnastica TaxID=73025 RepID=A0A7S4GHA9_9EUGL